VALERVAGRFAGEGARDGGTLAPGGVLGHHAGVSSWSWDPDIGAIDSDQVVYGECEWVEFWTGGGGDDLDSAIAGVCLPGDQ